MKMPREKSLNGKKRQLGQFGAKINETLFYNICLLVSYECGFKSVGECHGFPSKTPCVWFTIVWDLCVSGTNSKISQISHWSYNKEEGHLWTLGVLEDLYQYHYSTDSAWYLVLRAYLGHSISILTELDKVSLLSPGNTKHFGIRH